MGSMCMTEFRPARASNVSTVDAAPGFASTTRPEVVICEGYDAARLVFYGTDAANEAFTAQVYLVDRSRDSDGDGRTVYYHRHLVQVVCTLSATTGVGESTDLPATNFFCDAHVITVQGVGAAYDGLRAFVTTDDVVLAYTNTSDVPGEVVINHLGGAWGLLVNIETLTSAASGNALVKLFRNYG